jgi:hypothetical protein
MGLGVVAELVRLGVLSSTSDHASVVSINLFVALLCACIVLGHLLEENRWVNESITALIIVSTIDAAAALQLLLQMPTLLTT